MHSRVVIHRRDSSASDSSYDSRHTYSTAATVYSDAHSDHHCYKVDNPTVLKHPYSVQSHYAEPYYCDQESFYSDPEEVSSVGTYASTVASDEDLDEDEEKYGPYDEPEYVEDAYVSSAVPSTPSEFAQFFPSKRRLNVRHDDSVDGNMNLRVDTEVHTTEGRPVDLTLFYLRMHDLKNREFSLRRYCRDSGKEVCKSSRKYTKPSAKGRPTLQRSMSSALATLGLKSESKSSPASSSFSIKRHDSGYGSGSDDDDDPRLGPSPSTECRTSLPIPTNTTKLEFSNYAHIDVKRRGTKSSKRYEFEYWGSQYAWKRVARKNGDKKEISYHLINTDAGVDVAHIIPDPMTPAEAQLERDAGGWVPPSSMWISDSKVLDRETDVAQ